MLFRSCCLVAWFWLGLGGAWAQTALVVDDNTPVIFSDKTQVLVLVDPEGQLTLDQVRQPDARFEPASKVATIQPKTIYWIKQKITNASKVDRLIRVAQSGWTVHQNHVVLGDQVETLKTNGNSANYNWLAEINPFKTQIGRAHV